MKAHLILAMAFLLNFQTLLKAQETGLTKSTSTNILENEECVQEDRSEEGKRKAAEKFIVKTILQQMAVISGLSDNESAEAVRQFLLRLNEIDESQFVEKLGLTKSDLFTLALSVAGAAWGVEKAEEVEKATRTIEDLSSIAHAFGEQMVQEGEQWAQSGDSINWLTTQAQPVFDRLKNIFSDSQTSIIRLHLEAFGNLQRKKSTGMGMSPGTLVHLENGTTGPYYNGQHLYTEEEFDQKMLGVKKGILDSSFNMYLAGQAFSMAFQLGSILHTADVMRNAGIILDSTEAFEEEIVGAFAQLKEHFTYIKDNEFKAEVDSSTKLELARHVLFLERKMAQLQLVVAKKIGEITGLRNNTLIPKRNASIYSSVSNICSGAVTLYNANNMKLSKFYYSLGNIVAFLQISMGMTNAIQSGQLMLQIDEANRKLIGLKSIENMFDNISQTVLSNMD